MKILQTLVMIFCLATGIAFANFDATIPVLDMEEYQNPETRDQFVTDMHSALKEVGFFALINSGVDIDLLDRAYASIAEFFALPFEKKMEACNPAIGNQRGYSPGESAKGHAELDYKEFYHVARDKTECNWPNVWPEQGNLKEDLYGLFLALEEHKQILETALARAIGEEENFFANMTGEGETLLRVIHYPQNPPANQLWAAEHTDINLFTILPRATADGLQLLNTEGEWIDVKVPENAFIVNCGDMLENLTNGEFHSGLHRVVAKDEGYERYSAVFFVHPRGSDRLDPLAQCVERTGGIQQYVNCSAQEILEERLVDLGLASEEMMAHLAQSGFMERQIELGRASLDAMVKLKEAGLASGAVLEELEGVLQVETKHVLHSPIPEEVEIAEDIDEA